MSRSLRQRSLIPFSAACNFTLEWIRARRGLVTAPMNRLYGYEGPPGAARVSAARSRENCPLETRPSCDCAGARHSSPSSAELLARNREQTMARASLALTLRSQISLQQIPLPSPSASPPTRIPARHIARQTSGFFADSRGNGASNFPARYRLDALIPIDNR